MTKVVSRGGSVLLLSGKFNISTFGIQPRSKTFYELHNRVSIPPTVYTCESLVSLELTKAILPSPEFVNLPSLKVIHFSGIRFSDDSAFETLISGCQVLERLTLQWCYYRDVKVVRVCSNSLLSFTHCGHSDPVVAIDAPRLDYLELCNNTCGYIIHNLKSLVMVDIKIVFDSRKRVDPNDINMMIRNFLVGISIVEDMVISPHTFKVINNYSMQQPLPLFPNLSFMCLTDRERKEKKMKWTMLLVLLERCPNLKSLVLESTGCLEKKGFSSFSGDRQFLSSLEYVEITSPLENRAVDLKVVSYFLENSTILKKLTLRLNDSGKKVEPLFTLEEILAIPRLSTSCQVVVLYSTMNKQGRL